MAKAPKTIEATAETVAPATEEKTGVAFGGTPFAGLFTQGREAVEKALGTSRERYEEVVKKVGDIGPRGLKALVEGTQVSTKGLETINAENIAFAKTRLETVVETSKKLAAARNVKEVFDLQTSYAKGAFEAYVAQSKKIGDIAKQVAQDSVKPVQSELKAIYAEVTGKQAA
jgi:phasin family protein